MIDQLIAALRISLTECKKYEDPARYIFELNQVLNRYKTNLFKAITAGQDYEHDPKEFFHFRIATSWRVGKDWGMKPKLLDNSPVLLYVNGFYPHESRKNRELTFNKTVDISDIIDMERIRSIKTDYYSFDGTMSDRDYMSENDLMEVNLGPDFINTSMYFFVEKVADEIINFSFQLNSQVYYTVAEQQTLDHIARHAAREEPRKYVKAQKPILKPEDELDQPADPVPPEPIKIDVPKQVDEMFGKTGPEGAKERLAIIREQAKKKANPHGGPRKRHRYW